MKNRFLRLPEDMIVQARNAILLIALFLSIELGILGFLVFQGLRTASLQMWILVIATSVSVLCQVAGMILSRSGRHELGVWLAFLPLGLVWILAVFVLSGLGYVMLTLAAVTFILVANLTLSSRQAILFGVIGIVSAIAILLLDIFLPVGRITITGFSTIVNYLVGAILLIFGYIIIRLYRNYSLRAKLIVAFLAVTVISLVIITIINANSSKTTLTNTIGNNLSILSTAQALQVGQTLQIGLEKLNTLALTSAVQQRAESGTAANTLSLAEINTLDQEWRAADTANNNSDPLVSRVLNDSLSAELLKFQAKYPENVEVFLTDLPGVSLATTNRTSDYLQSDEDWWQATYKNGQYIGQPEFDPSSKTLAINMAVAVRAHDSNRIVGVLRTTVNINSFANVLSAGLFGQTGQTKIYLPDGQEIKLVLNGTGKYELTVEKANIDINTLTKSAGKYQTISIDNVPSLVGLSRVSVFGNNEETTLIKNLGWYTAAHQGQLEALAPVTAQTQNNVILAVIVAVLVALAAVGLAQLLAGPIVRLTKTAESIAGGEINTQAKVESQDEIGTLAGAFNNMTQQLREFIGTLEGRVAARTKDLATVAEVGTATATILQTDKLLQAVVDLTKERFNLYHSHIYLLDQTGENLVLASGAGEAGRQMVAEGRSIPLNREQSLVARTARERKGVIVNDVTQAPDFLPNPLLPDTRSELAVPMIIGGNVIGVFDVQSEQVGRFTDSDINIQTTLAAQVATSIQNVRSFEQSKAQADLESLVNAIGQKIQRTTTVDDTLQTAIREVGLALGASRVSANLQASRQIDGNQASRN
jgi:putative methionine-R-sulfoxide reductase with GAF domain/HAMP domain-containing protein